MALREGGKKQTYSNGDSDRVDLLCSWETDGRQKQRDLERSQEGREFFSSRKTLLLTSSINTCFEFNNKIIRCSSHFYYLYSNDNILGCYRKIYI